MNENRFNLGVLSTSDTSYDSWPHLKKVYILCTHTLLENWNYILFSKNSYKEFL